MFDIALHPLDRVGVYRLSRVPSLVKLQKRRGFLPSVVPELRHTLDTLRFRNVEDSLELRSTVYPDAIEWSRVDR